MEAEQQRLERASQREQTKKQRGQRQAEIMQEVRQTLELLVAILQPADERVGEQRQIAEGGKLQQITGEEQDRDGEEHEQRPAVEHAAVTPGQPAPEARATLASFRRGGGWTSAQTAGNSPHTAMTRATT